MTNGYRACSRLRLRRHRSRKRRSRKRNRRSRKRNRRKSHKRRRFRASERSKTADVLDVEKMMASGDFSGLLKLVRDGGHRGGAGARGGGLVEPLGRRRRQPGKDRLGGRIPPLVKLVRDGGTARERENAAGALRALSRNDANRVKIASAGGIPPLVKMIRDGGTAGSGSTRRGP